MCPSGFVELRPRWAPERLPAAEEEQQEVYEGSNIGAIAGRWYWREVVGLGSGVGCRVSDGCGALVGACGVGVVCDCECVGGRCPSIGCGVYGCVFPCG